MEVIMRLKRKLAEHVWYHVRTAVTLFPSVAQYSSNAPSTTKGCACFGRFYGRGHVWGDRYWSEILLGEPPPEAGSVDWAWVEEMAKKEIPAAKTYALGLGQPQPGGRDGKGPFFVQNGPRFRQSTRLTTPHPPRNPRYRQPPQRHP
jgi:hypothetical protein